MTEPCCTRILHKKALQNQCATYCAKIPAPFQAQAEPDRVRPTPIAQDGRTFVFTNEFGLTSNGEFQSGHTIRVTGWNLTAIVSPNLKQLTFSNGTVWTR
jgi:hypothetical protein